MSSIYHPSSNNVFNSLRLQQFRSYDDFAIELSPSVNIVVGPNASGKTNLLEAMLIICGNSSYRVNYGDLIKVNCEWTRIDADLRESTRVLKIKNNHLIERTYEINKKVKKYLKFEDILPVVLFEPEHMRLLTGSPSLRRDFIDSYLLKINPEFNKLMTDYLHVVAQRNKLLKQGENVIKTQIFVWNIRLSELGGQIFKLRYNLINDINLKISDIYSKIAGTKNVVKIEYLTPLQRDNYESSLLTNLAQGINKDFLRGFTSFGPHREDILIKIGDTPASISASRGETRTIILSLKLIEIELLQKIRALKPLVLLDDVFSELDGVRRTMLTKYLQDYQTIITTTDADVVAKNFAQSSNLISL